MANVSKERLIFGLFLISLIVLIELVLHRFHLPAWPAFMVMIFFFETHMNLKRAPHLLLGGLFGILGLVLIGIFLKVFAPVLGVMTAQLIFICLFVYLIVALGEVLPMVLNNYAFMFFLVSGLAVKIDGEAHSAWLWMGIELVGGVFVIAGIIGIGKLMALLPMLRQGVGQARNEA